MFKLVGLYGIISEKSQTKLLKNNITLGTAAVISTDKSKTLLFNNDYYSAKIIGKISDHVTKLDLNIPQTPELIGKSLIISDIDFSFVTFENIFKKQENTLSTLITDQQINTKQFYLADINWESGLSDKVGFTSPQYNLTNLKRYFII